MFSCHLSFSISAWPDCVMMMMNRIQMRWGTDGLYPYLHVRLDAATVPGSHYGYGAFCFHHTSMLLPAVTAAPVNMAKKCFYVSVPQELVCGWETMVMNCGLREFRTDQGACSSLSATLWSLPSVFMRRSFVFLTANTSTYLPDVLLSAVMLFFHIVSQLSETAEERQHTYFAQKDVFLDWSNCVEVVCTKGLGKSSYMAISRNMWRSD